MIRIFREQIDDFSIDIILSKYKLCFIYYLLSITFWNRVVSNTNEWNMNV